MKNKKFAKILATVMVVAVAMVGFAGCANNKDNEKYMKDDTEVVETVDYVLTDFVSGLKDWTVEVGAKNIDFLNGVEFNDEVVKEVKVDDSKVNLEKEGKYDLVYTIVPTDDSISDVAVTKTVTVKVVSEKVAQEEADKGNQVATSNNEVKKDSEGKTPQAKPEKKPAETPAKKPDNKPFKPADGNNGGNSKPDNKPAEKPADKPEKPADKPSNPGNGGGNNQGNDDNNQGGNGGNTQPPKEEHKHSWTNTGSTAGDCKNKGKVTQKCSCGETRTVDGNFGDHNWKDHYETIHHDAVYEDKPVWAFDYECNTCHKHFANEDDVIRHEVVECGGRYKLNKWIDHYEKELVQKAYDETVKSGKDCTICGEHTK